MKKTQKRERGILGGRGDTRGTEKARGVASNGKVGRCQPPEAYKWRPGKSGNPSGKPSAQRAVTLEVFRTTLGRVDPKLDKSQLEIIVAGIVRRAKQGSHKDIKVVLAYGLGLPQQSMNLDVVNYTDAVTRMRAARQIEQADATISKYFHELPGNGHSTPQEARAAALLADQDLSTAREDDAGQLAAAQPKPKIAVEL